MFRFPSLDRPIFVEKKKNSESLVKKQVLEFTSTRSCVISTNCLKLPWILRFCSLLDIWESCFCYLIWLRTKGPRNQAFVLSSPAFAGSHNPSWVYFYFLPDRPTHLHEREGDGKRNILLGWPYEGTIDHHSRPQYIMAIMHINKQLWNLYLYFRLFDSSKIYSL